MAGKSVIEARMAGIDKGVGFRALIAEKPRAVGARLFGGD